MKAWFLKIISISISVDISLVLINIESIANEINDYPKETEKDELLNHLEYSKSQKILKTKPTYPV